MRRKVLVVDDVAINRDILAEMLADSFDVIEAGDGEEALAAIEKHENDLAVILLDLMMPVLDGFGVLNAMAEKSLLSKIPVLIISGETSAESEKQCLELGAVDFVHKPFDEALVLCRVRNVIALYEYKNGLEAKVAEQTEELRVQNAELLAQKEQLETYNRTIVEVLGAVVESRNLESGDHIKRVKGYTEILARQLMKDFPEYGLTERTVELIVSASALHDVGKIAIPDDILLKPGRLTPEEYEVMKEHTTRGCHILDSIEDAWSEEYRRVSYEICRYHHERFDGRGYPDQLSGDEIPISAQIVSIADVYDALIHTRVYKNAFSEDTAYRMIIGGECGTFSPKLLSAFESSRLAFEKLTAGAQA